MNKHKCEVCGCPVTVSGNTTNSYSQDYSAIEAKLSLAVKLISYLVENGDSNNFCLFDEAREFLKQHATSTVDVKE